MTLHLPPEPEMELLGTELSGHVLECYGFTTEQLRADRLAVARAVVEQCAQIVEHQRVAYNWNEREALAKAIRALLDEKEPRNGD